MSALPFLRCKFRITSIARTESFGVTLRLMASNQKDGDNKDWSQWTPSGTLEIQVTNPSAVKKIEGMKPGEHYYIDFAPVPDAKTAELVGAAT